MQHTGAGPDTVVGGNLAHLRKTLVPDEQAGMGLCQCNQFGRGIKGGDAMA